MKKYGIVATETYYTLMFKWLLGALGAIVGYFQIVMINNANLFGAIFGVVLLDFVVGVIKAYKFGNFSPRKAMNVVYYLASYYAVVFVVLQIELAHPAAAWLSETVFIPILILTLVGTLKNMDIIGMIKAEILVAILAKIDQHKNDITQSKVFDATIDTSTNPPIIEVKPTPPITNEIIEG